MTQSSPFLYKSHPYGVYQSISPVVLVILAGLGPPCLPACLGVLAVHACPLCLVVLGRLPVLCFPFLPVGLTAVSVQVKYLFSSHSIPSKLEQCLKLINLTKNEKLIRQKILSELFSKLQLVTVSTEAVV